MLSWAVLLSMALFSVAAMAQAATEAPATLRVVIDNAYAPYSFLSDDGRPQGILVDQWQAWEKRTGLKVEIHALDWESALLRMRAGEFDVIDDIVETPERRTYFDFTPPYATVEASIFFRRDIAGIADLASLKGFPVGVKAGDQHVDKLAENGVTTVIAFRNNAEIIESAKQHKINVFVADAPSALYLLNKAGIAAEFRHSRPIFRDELRHAVRKGDTTLLRTVSRGFEAIDPHELKQIDEKWFGYAMNGSRLYLLYGGYAAAAALLFMAGLVAWNRALSRRVLQRTAELRESELRLRQIAENMQALSRRLVELQESERRELSRELHDQIGQTLTAAHINMEVIRTRLTEHDDPVIRERNDDSLALLESVFAAIENVMYDLRPPMIDEFGLVTALHWYAKRFGDRTAIRVEVRGPESLRCSPGIELSLFRIAQEALNNVARHARARRAAIELRAGVRDISLSIEDDGVGFDPVGDGGERIGFGLATMRERSEALGGTFEAESAKGKGTRITVKIPRCS